MPADTGGKVDVVVDTPGLAIQVKGGRSVASVVLRNAMSELHAAGPEEMMKAVVLRDRAGTRVVSYIVFLLEDYADSIGRAHVAAR